MPIENKRNAAFLTRCGIISMTVTIRYFILVLYRTLPFILSSFGMRQSIGEKDRTLEIEREHQSQVRMSIKTDETDHATNHIRMHRGERRYIH